MHHKATLTVGTVVGRPYHIQCSCGPAGDFKYEREAVDWMSLRHFSKLGPSETFEIYVPGAHKTPPPAPAPPSKEAK